MGLLDRMKELEYRLNDYASRNGVGAPPSEPPTLAWPTPDKNPDRFLANHERIAAHAETRTLDEEDVNGFLAASDQAPDRRRMDADEFMRVMRAGPESRRLRRIERDLEWLRREARFAGVPAAEIGDVP